MSLPRIQPDLLFCILWKSSKPFPRNHTKFVWKIWHSTPTTYQSNHQSCWERLRKTPFRLFRYLLLHWFRPDRSPNKQCVAKSSLILGSRFLIGWFESTVDWPEGLICFLGCEYDSEETECFQSWIICWREEAKSWSVSRYICSNSGKRI